MENNKSGVSGGRNTRNLYDFDSVMSTSYRGTPSSGRSRTNSGNVSGGTVKRRKTNVSKTKPKGTRLSQPKVKHKPFAKGKGIDIPFLIIVLILLTVGIVMMFSASYPVGF